MRKIQTIIAITLIVFAWSCGGGNEETTENTERPASMIEKEVDPMESIGVGPITSVELGEIDQAMVEKGREIYEAKCTACHKADAKFIGPAPTDILSRRTPEWIMNMILNPDGMVKEDPTAKALLMEFNGSPMANQNLTEEEARNVLEYFRTLTTK
jgi:cytochrome c